ncbi:winged helix-turn-helix domain-containing protein [Novosphingobium sp. ZN18A2]|uniref:winged helix-turn-helix domain-containing protein n=1 Tax=Novosphingobium sp. ZN18A2 TaxID=3079861 RepID=UPI0030CCAE4F
MRAFCWYSDRSLPAALDLVERGWLRLEPDREGGLPPGNCAVIVDGRGSLPASGGAPADRGRMLVAGVQCSAARAMLLAQGYGDAISLPAAQEEVEARALRLLNPVAQSLAVRRAGPLLLDLAARDAWLAGRRIALHPREFGVAWILAERPGEPVGKARLLRDLCGLSHDPGTNRIAVHVSRLRAKLAAAGVTGLIRTSADGSYRLAASCRADAPRRDEGVGRSRAIGQTGTKPETERIP